MGNKQKTPEDEPYLLIPESVIRDPRIHSLSEAAVYSLILGFSRKNELLRGGQGYIAGWTKLSRERVNRILSSLEGRGLIRKLPLEQHGCMIRYGYMTSGCPCELSSHAAGELSSHATCEVPSEITSQKTSEITSHRNTIEKSKSNYARTREGKKNRFNDFEQHSYDFEELERILTQ
jgi:hypothetical protein